MSDMKTPTEAAVRPQAPPVTRSRCTHDRAELVPATGEHFCPDCSRSVAYYDLDAEERGECRAEGEDWGLAWE